MNLPEIVVVGSSNTDMVVKMDRLPKPGETRLGGAFSTAAGGKGANQAVAAARAGGRVTLVARLGSDAYGDAALAGFVKEGIRTEFVFRSPKSPSGVALIFVDAEGNNSIAVAPGANAGLSPADVEKARSAIAGAGALLVQLETPLETVLAAVRIAVEAGVPVILNPAPAQPLPDELLAGVSIFTPNASEAAFYSALQRVEGKRHAREAAEILMQRGARTVLVTLGSGGVLLAGPEEIRMARGFEVAAVDTTGAGDTFNGAFAVALAEGKPLAEAVRFAQAAAAISVTRPGAQPSAPTREEIERFLESRK